MNLSGVQIICFASSYAIALALEISRLLFRSAVRGVLLVGIAAAGLTAHSIYLYYRAVHTSGVPLSSNRDWCLLAAWVLAVVYLYLLCSHPRTPFGLVLLPLVLGLIGTAAGLADPRPFAREPASKVWGVIHGTSILLAAVAVLLGFAAGVTYLGQRWRLRRKHGPLRSLKLPSLEWLQRANSHAILTAVFLLGIGVVSGILLNSIRHVEAARRLPWSDPVVLGTLGMFAWLLAAVVLGHLRRPAWQGRTVAYLTVASFVALVIVLALVLLPVTRHGGRKAERSSEVGSRKSEVASTTVFPNSAFRIPHSEFGGASP
ncbi:MAG: cytochrome c biogenesis protein CcsA [Thermoguttaceae bacterium]